MQIRSITVSNPFNPDITHLGAGSRAQISSRAAQQLNHLRADPLSPTLPSHPSAQGQTIPRFTQQSSHPGSCRRIIYNITAIPELLQYRIRLLRQIDLKSNTVRDLSRLAVALILGGGDGNDGDEVDECTAVFAIVDETSLTLLVLQEGLVEVADGVRGGELAWLTALDLARGMLEETTVATQDLGFRISSESAGKSE